MADSQFRLLVERRFLPFFGTQAFGAFNDNVYKNALVIIATFHTAAFTTLNPGLLSNIAGGLFILPFVVFSGIAGQLADRYDKTLVLRWVKVCEVGIMALAGIGFATRQMSLLLTALFLMGAHSTFFAPAKYGLLPQVLVADELVGGNALLEMGTFLAILLGTVLGGELAKQGDIAVLDGTLVGIALAGLLFSLAIPRLPAVAPELRIDWNPWSSSLANLRAARVDPVVFLAILGISWFWFYGIAVLAQVPSYAKLVLNGTEGVVQLLLVGFSLGVGVGSLLCERLSGRHLEIGLVPLGSFGLTAFGVDLYFATPASPAAVPVDWLAFLAHGYAWRVLLDVVLIGVFGGLYIVPLYALMQRRAPRAFMSRVISANSIWNALFMTVASVFCGLLVARGVTVAQIFLIVALLNLAVAVFIYARLPEFLLRFLAWVVARVIYRIRVAGLEHVPADGAALVVCNHVSLADALVLSAAVYRPMRFVMEAAIFRLPLVRLVFRGMKAIPIASRTEDVAVREAAFAAVIAELAAGELVCIFPEGRLTVDGELAEFRPGLMRVMKDHPVPVLPVAISGLWGSMFSRRYHGPLRWLPRRLWARVDVTIGAPLAPAEVTPAALRTCVAALRGPIA